MNLNKVNRVVATRSFENAVKQLKKKHETKTLEELYDVVTKLANYEVTKEKSNHPLENANGHKDLHLKGGKLILLYKYEDDVLTVALRLQDVVNHNQLKSYELRKYKAPTREYDVNNINNSTIVSSQDFMNWYNNLDEEDQWKVDDIADTEGIPFYEDASDQELSRLMHMYQNSIESCSIFSDDDVEDNFSVEDTDQEYHSDATSINSTKLPTIYRMVDFHPGDVVLDFGGGKFDNAVNYLKDKDVTLLVYDPYNRSKEHNDEVIQILKEHGGADAAVNSNVLNVIKEASARSTVLKNIQRLTKKGAPIYITVYEGRGDNQEGPTKAGYQLNRKTADYLEEIQEIFPDAVRKGKLIIAHNGVNVSSSTSVKCSVTISDEDMHDMLTDLRSDLKRVLLHILTSDDFGFSKEQAERKSDVDVIVYPDHPEFNIRVKAELDYDNLDTLAKILDEEVLKYYVPNAYFDFEGPESLVTGFELSDVSPEVLKAYNASDGVTSDHIEDILKELKADLQACITETMTSVDFGFDEKEVKEYSRITIDSDPNYDGIRIEVGAELSYEGLDKLRLALDKILVKYAPDAYFDMAQPGILETYFAASDIVSDIVESCDIIQASYYDVPEQPLDPPEYDEGDEIEAEATIKIPFNQVITINHDGSWDYSDDEYNFTKTDDGKSKHYDDEYNVYLDDNIGIVENLDDFLEDQLPATPGTYRIQGTLTLVYDIENIRSYSNNDGYWSEEDGFNPSSDEIYTEDAHSYYNKSKSKLEDFRYTKLK